MSVCPCLCVSLVNCGVGVGVGVGGTSFYVCYYIILENILHNGYFRDRTYIYRKQNQGSY